MYGGLFGDLPAAKNGKGEGDGDDDKQTPSVAAAQPPASVKAKAPVEPVKKKNQSSVLKGVGVAGTSMAFVPTSALQRRRNNKRPAPAPSMSMSLVPPAAVKRQEHPQSVPPQQPSSLSTTWSVKLEDVKTKVVNNPSIKTEPEDDSSRPVFCEAAEQHADENLDMQQQQQQQILDDPYDPMVPNDLLMYWENKALAVERRRVEQEAKQSLEEQRRIRQLVEREREELQRSGNVDKLVEHHVRRTMGRGRGLSNLPAWLVEKQRKEREQDAATRDNS